MARIHYDTKCEELARHFLADTPEGFTEAEALDLTGEIQRAVEDWWCSNKPPVTEWLDPSLPAPSNPLIISPVSGTLIEFPKLGSLAIHGETGEPIVTIRCDGRIELNPEITLDDAARAFWDAVIRLNPR